MKKLIVFSIILNIVININSIEKLIMKNNDVYSGNVVLIDAKRVVFYMFEKRFEFKITEISKVDFSESDNEIEIILEDNSKIKGTIVDQDEDFLTVGSSAGITPIEKKKIKEIFNPLLAKYREEAKKFIFKNSIGINPNAAFILNNFSNYFKSYWNIKLYYEGNFTLPVFFGFDLSFIMLYPEFGNFNDFIYIIPINFTLKYIDNFYRHKNENHPIRRLYWHITFGMGFAPIIFYQKEENITNYSVAISAELNYGIKYYITKIFGIGINGETLIIAENNTLVLLQSVGLNIDLKF